MNIDYTTLALVLAMIYVIVAIVFHVLMEINKFERGIEIWFISSMISIIGFAALFAKDVTAPYGQMVGTFSLLTSTYLIIEGIWRFRNIGLKEKRKRLHLIVLLFFFIVAVFTAENATLRYLILDALMVGMCPFIVFAILKGTEELERWLSYIFAAAFIFESIWFVIRWCLALSDALGGTPIMEHPFMGTIYFASIVWLLMYVFSVLLIISYRAQARLQQAAEKDALTGLYNRRKLDIRFKTINDRKKSPKEDYVVYLLDINGFKNVNDTYGHIFGDMLLVELAKKLEGIIRTEDFACRYGGDEFIVIMKVASGETEAINARNRIQRMIEEPFAYRGYSVHMKIAIGYIIAKASDMTLDEMLKRADKSMYLAKNLSGESTQILEQDPEMSAG